MIMNKFGLSMIRKSGFECGAVDGILQAQSQADCEYFARHFGRRILENEAAVLRSQFLKAYRWQHILSGAAHPRFPSILFSLITPDQRERVEWRCPSWSDGPRKPPLRVRGAAISLSLWMVLGFAAWTILVLIIGVGVRRWALVLGGQADLTNLPADVPHGRAPYRRAMRAHANCLENLSVFTAIVLVGAVTRLNPPGMDALAATTLGAHIVQTSVSLLFFERHATIAVRFAFFLVQVLTISSMGFLLARSAIHGT